MGCIIKQFHHYKVTVMASKALPSLQITIDSTCVPLANTKIVGWVAFGWRFVPLTCTLGTKLLPPIPAGGAVPLPPSPAFGAVPLPPILAVEVSLPLHALSRFTNIK
ncbi:hypothetical protein Prudu_016770 [Prunus dulcis]|uniref:Uncharacterized protein n=1 Tax=Prunus dulcis TaxID=3755 RepID=A0A4Y1RM05_PRUDU|nr:hypothetical protein Prudu_016770 [Prunus dulcis]